MSKFNALLYLIIKFPCHLLCVFSILTFSNFLLANNINFKSLNVNDGLPYNSIRAILQDEQGNLWIGTELGLAQYNGYHLKTYSSTDFSTNRLTNAYIVALAADKNNNLWIATKENGLGYYNQILNRFILFPDNKKNGPNLNSNKIHTIHFTGDSDLWIAGDKGLDKLDVMSKKITHFSYENINQSINQLINVNQRLDENSEIKKIRVIMSTSDGSLWLGTDQGLILFNPQKKLFQRVKLITDKQPRIFSLVDNETGGFLIGTDHGLFQYQLNLGVSRVYSAHNVLNSLTILSLLKDSQGTLWIGTFRNGLYRLDQENNIEHYLPDRSLASSLTDKTVLTLFQDASDEIWVGTYRSGVNYFNPDNYYFGSYNNSLGSIPCLPSSNILSAYYYHLNNTMLLGTNAGLVEVDFAKKKCSVYSRYQKHTSQLSSDEIFSIADNENGSLWLGTARGIDRIDLHNLKITNLGEQIKNSSVYRILKYGDDLLLGTSSGLYRLFIDAEKIISVSEENKSNVNDFDIDKKGIVWIASDSGLLMLDTKNWKLNKADKNRDSILNNPISAITIDKKDNVFLTIDGQGLFQYSSGSRVLNEIGLKLGLKEKNGFSGLYTDKKNIVWLSTLNSGIFKINSLRSKLINYHVSDGLHSELFNFGSFAEYPDGKLLFGGKTGLNFFDPEKITINKTPPIVSLTRFKRFGKTVFPQSDPQGFKIDQPITKLKELNLSYKDSVFGFDFSAAHYVDPESIVYAYKLDGFDLEWNSVDAKNRGVSYNNVDPGEYVFRVKARTKAGVWSEHNVALKVNISPAPWLTWWAYAIYLWLLIMGIMFLIKHKTLSLEKKSRFLQQAVAERTSELVNEKNKINLLLEKKNEELANISHEFKTPLTLILGPAEQINKLSPSRHISNKAEVIKRNANRLLRMVDQLLHIETFRVKSITERSVQDCAKIISLITESFQELAERKNVNLTIEKVDELFFELTPDTLEKILLNLLSNSLKYTQENGEIKVEAKRENNNQFKIMIADTGVGISKDKLACIFDRFQRAFDESHERVSGVGIGLALVKALVEGHQGKISIQSEIGIGTKVEVFLPIVGEVSAIKTPQLSNNEIIALELSNLASHSNTPKNQIVDFQKNEKSRFKILIIEDNQDMRNYIRESLFDDYNCLLAGDGKEGLELALQQIPDIIISDVMMPRMNGYQVTHSLRNSQNTSHIPIILLTARGDRTSRLKGWQKKADEYLTKPFDVEELHIRIRNLLDIREIVQNRLENMLFQQPRWDAEVSDDSGSKQLKLEQVFMHKLNRSLNQHYEDPDLKIELVAKELAMSQRQLLRKLKGLLDMTPVEYLRRFRLEKSRGFLLQGEPPGNVAYDAGFSSHSHFSKCFKIQYGCSPSEFVTMEHKNSA